MTIREEAYARLRLATETRSRLATEISMMISMKVEVRLRCVWVTKSCVDEVQTLEYVAHNYTTKAEEPVGGGR